jgi:hypothetical protein
MPRRGRLVTFLTTCFAAPLTVLAVAAFQAASVAGETVRQGALQVSFGGSVAPHDLPRTGPIAVGIRSQTDIPVSPLKVSV